MKVSKYIVLMLAIVSTLFSSCSKEEEVITIDKDNYESIINVWQSHFLPGGKQTGSFTAMFDVVATADSISATLGTQGNVAKTFSDVSTLIRFNDNGEIDVYDSATDGAIANNVVKYSKNVVNSIRVEVDILSRKFDVYVSVNNGAEVDLAKGIDFYAYSPYIDQWSVMSNWQDRGEENGILKVNNISSVTKNYSNVPVVVSDSVIRSEVDVETLFKISVFNPINSDISLSVEGLPEFATFEDKGKGNGIIKSLAPEDQLKDFKMLLKANNGSQTGEQDLVIKVVKVLEIVVDMADDFANSDGTVDGATRNVLWSGASTYNSTAIMPFKIPSLVDGEIVKFASLSVVVDQNKSYGTFFDLYGLPFRSSSEVLVSDYFTGEYGSGANSTPIQTKFFKPSGGVDTDNDYSVVSEVGVEVDFANYVNSQFQAASAGDFIFLRVNASKSEVAPYETVRFYSGDEPTDEKKPVLKLYIGK